MSCFFLIYNVYHMLNCHNINYGISYFFGVLNFGFLPEKCPENFDLAVRSTPCACCAEPGSSSASAAPLRRCCWRRRWGLCLGLRPGPGRLMGGTCRVKSLENSPQTPGLKIAKGSLKHHFFPASCSTSGVYSP